MATQNFNYATAPTQFVTAANSIKFAYRRLGVKKNVSVIYFNHLSSNMDNCNPRIMDGIETLTFLKDGKELSHYQK
jgi:hypothetical protein